MSGIETLGAIAATTQLAQLMCKIVEVIIEVRQNLPSQMQSWGDELGTLKDTITSICQNPNLQAPSLAVTLHAICTKVDSLLRYLSKYKIDPRLPTHQRYFRLFRAKKFEPQILRHLSELERDKVTLILQVNALLPDALSNIHRLQYQPDSCRPANVSHMSSSFAKLPHLTTSAAPQAAHGLPTPPMSPTAPTQVTDMDNQPPNMGHRPPIVEDYDMQGTDSAPAAHAHEHGPALHPKTSNFDGANIQGSVCWIGNSDPRFSGIFQNSAIQGTGSMIGQHDDSISRVFSLVLGDMKLHGAPKGPQDRSEPTKHDNKSESKFLAPGQCDFTGARVVGNFSCIGSSGGAGGSYCDASIHGDLNMIGDQFGNESPAVGFSSLLSELSRTMKNNPAAGVNTQF